MIKDGDKFIASVLNQAWVCKQNTEKESIQGGFEALFLATQGVSLPVDGVTALDASQGAVSIPSAVNDPEIGSFSAGACDNQLLNVVNCSTEEITISAVTPEIDLAGGQALQFVWSAADAKWKPLSGVESRDTNCCEVTQVGHGFSVLDSIYYSQVDGAYMLADVTDADKQREFVVIEVDDADTFKVADQGFFELASPHGLTVGDHYFQADALGGSSDTRLTVGWDSPTYQALSETKIAVTAGVRPVLLSTSSAQPGGLLNVVRDSQFGSVTNNSTTYVNYDSFTYTPTDVNSQIVIFSNITSRIIGGTSGTDNIVDVRMRVNGVVQNEKESGNGDNTTGSRDTTPFYHEFINTGSTPVLVELDFRRGAGGNSTISPSESEIMIMEYKQ